MLSPMNQNRDLLLKQKIRFLREIFGIKQSVMAERLNMSQGNYHKLENGNRYIGIGELSVIAQELNSTVTQLLFFPDDDVSQFDCVSFSHLFIKLTLHFSGQNISFTPEETKFLALVIQKNKRENP